MPLELEAKVRVAEFAAVRARLRAAGAVEEGDALEVNTYFDTPDRALLSRDSGLRVRTTRSIWQKQDRHVVTFKGPRQPGDVKAREEIEFSVESADGAARLLAALGYNPDLSFEKRRETWSLGDCEVVLDELPLIGRFVEIEGPSVEAIESTRGSIGLGGEPLITDSYIAMLVRACRERGLADRMLKLDP